MVGAARVPVPAPERREGTGRGTRDPVLWPNPSPVAVSRNNEGGESMCQNP